MRKALASHMVGKELAPAPDTALIPKFGGGPPKDSPDTQWRRRPTDGTQQATWGSGPESHV